MPYFKNQKTGEVFFYDNEEEMLQYGAKELVMMTKSEVDALLNPQPLPVSEILQTVKDELRLLRRDILDAVTGIGFRASVSGNTVLAQEAAKVSQQLLDITDDDALNAAQTSAEMHIAGLSAYRRIADSASPELRSAFKAIEE